MIIIKAAVNADGFTLLEFDPFVRVVSEAASVLSRGR